VADDARLEAIKKDLAGLIKRGRRSVAFEDASPSKWWFGKIVDPRTGDCFTPSGVWDFIAEELAKDRTHIKEIELQKPPGKKAYVFCVPSKKGAIYVKVQLGEGDWVIGRSFHLSGEG
jgi:hypothetical protein